MASGTNPRVLEVAIAIVISIGTGTVDTSAVSAQMAVHQLFPVLKFLISRSRRLLLLSLASFLQLHCLENTPNKSSNCASLPSTALVLGGSDSDVFLSSTHIQYSFTFRAQ